MLKLRRKIAKHYRTRTLAKVSVRFLLNKLTYCMPNVNKNNYIKYLLQLTSRQNFTINKIIMQYYFLIFREYLSELVFKKTNTNHPEKKQKILYYSPYPSHPGNHGNQSTIQKFGKILRSKGFHVDFVVLESDLFNENDLKEMQFHWDSVTVIKNYNWHIDDKMSTSYDKWYQYGMGEQIGILSRKFKSNTIICSYIFHSKILEYVSKNTKKIIDTHDKMANRHLMLKGKGIEAEFFSCSEHDEAQYLQRADIVFARNQKESDYFNQILKSSISLVVPHFEEPTFKLIHSKKLSKIGIVSSNNNINLCMIIDLLEACRNNFGDTQWPVKLIIAGDIKKSLVENKYLTSWSNYHNCIELLGFVKNIAEFYSDVDLIVCPVTVGTGINVKTVEAFAYGMPLLSTTNGNKGIESKEKRHNFQSVNILVETLSTIIENENEINRLALEARNVYEKFYLDSLETLLRGVGAADKMSAKLIATNGEILLDQRVNNSQNRNISSFMELYVSWENGRSLQHRGHAFPNGVLAELERYLPAGITTSAETGCGKSTVLFSNYSRKHLVFALDDRSSEQIKQHKVVTADTGHHAGEYNHSSVEFYRSCPLTRLQNVEEIFGPTQLTLVNFKHTEKYNLVMLDGPHGYPFPDLEYYFFYPHIAEGGLLVVDDVNIPSIGRMADILIEDDMWEYVQLIQATLILRRTSKPLTNPFGDEWYEQKYNRYRVSPNRDIHLSRIKQEDAISTLKLDETIYRGR